MDAKLESYRLRKRRKEVLNNIKAKFMAMLPLSSSKNDDETKKESCVIQPVPEYILKTALSDTTSETLSDVEEVFEEEAEQDKVPQNRGMRYFLWAVYFLFWATCYAIAIELKFGIVYLLFSALFGMYFNTRTGPRRKHEMSAYSVFNKDCESIDGTLKAEQFEREIRYGPTSVR